MSATHTTTHQPTPRSPLRRLVARYPVTAFLGMAFVFGWSAMLPLLLSESGPFGLVPIELLSQHSCRSSALRYRPSR